MRRLFAVLMIAGAVTAAVFAGHFLVFLQTPSGDRQQTVVVEKGMPFARIAQMLGEKGVIAHPTYFKVYVLMMRAAPKIRAGEYEFAAGLKPDEVLSLLLEGDFSTRRITIPEGWALKEIAKSLAAQGLVDEAKFLTKARDPEFAKSLGVDSPTLEGYLYPDTYEIYRPKDEAEVLTKFVERFNGVWRKDFEARAAFLGMTRQQVVTLASIVEKETGSADERPVIASVFLNRLRIGMPLATDPTVIYGIPDFDGNITRRHLNTPGPYNTYLNVGLPPTPIASPGAASLRAVLYPAMTEYLYFVSKNDGTHQFSKTEREHYEAVRQYQINRSK